MDVMDRERPITPLAHQIRKFIEEAFLFGPSGSLADSDSFLEHGIVDSTGILELIAFLQDTYGIRIEDEDIVPDNLDSIERISAYLKRKLDGTRAIGLDGGDGGRS